MEDLKVVLRPAPDDYRGHLDCVDIISPEVKLVLVLDEVDQAIYDVFTVDRSQLLGQLECRYGNNGNLLAFQEFTPAPGVQVEWVEPPDEWFSRHVKIARRADGTLEFLSPDVHLKPLHKVCRLNAEDDVTYQVLTVAGVFLGTLERKEYGVRVWDERFSPWDDVEVEWIEEGHYE